MFQVALWTNPATYLSGIIIVGRHASRTLLMMIFSYYGRADERTVVGAASDGGIDAHGRDAHRFSSTAVLRSISISAPTSALSLPDNAEVVCAQQKTSTSTG